MIMCVDCNVPETQCKCGNNQPHRVNIINPPKSWWPGDKRVEKYMIPVSRELDKIMAGGATRTRIYNVAYEAVCNAINDYGGDKK